MRLSIRPVHKELRVKHCMTTAGLCKQLILCLVTTTYQQQLTPPAPLTRIFKLSVFLIEYVEVELEDTNVLVYVFARDVVLPAC